MSGRRRRIAAAPLLIAAFAFLPATLARATSFCPILKSPDGFVALRAGPGMQHRIVARMKEDDEVEALGDADKSGWIAVKHWWGQQRLDDKTRNAYRKGYVHKRYVGECG